MSNCDSCKCNPNEYMLDVVSFTLQDLGVKYLEGITDTELLEIVNRKVRMLFNMCIAAGIDQEILEEAMNG